jgi:hypothetical protein
VTNTGCKKNNNVTGFVPYQFPLNFFNVPFFDAISCSHSGEELMAELQLQFVPPFSAKAAPYKHGQRTLAAQMEKAQRKYNLLLLLLQSTVLSFINSNW